MQGAEVWFVKLDVCVPLGIFAVGNSKGKILIYPIIPSYAYDSKETATDRNQRVSFDLSSQLTFA
jgi:hypothetical protein